MFQYAVARALSIIHGELLKLDVSDLISYKLHQGFELNKVFDCPVTVATNEDVRTLLGWQSSRIIRRTIAHPSLKLIRKKHFVVEPYFHYWPGIQKTPSSCYLLGYWQSERYFSNVAEIIRSDYTFRHPLSRYNHELAQKIKTVNSISLHVRRGDYVTNHKTQSVHGLCSLNYYATAIRRLAARVEKPHFFVFSDDIAWALKNLNVGFPCEYVGHNRDVESYRDMQLMSLCKHNIIANSSFSWWGAWLNNNPGKIVISPQSWFRNSNNSLCDLFPASWIVV